MSDRPVLRGHRVYRPWYLQGNILNRINQRIAKRNLKSFPRLAAFSFDNIALVINLEGRYEADSLNILARFLKECVDLDFESSAVDIGANIGNHSVFFAESFRTVLAFEPHPRIYELLRFNSFGRRIIPLNYGLSNAPSTRLLSVDQENLGASRILTGDADPQHEGSNYLRIEVCRLDDVPEILEQQRISLVKIDVEGHELQVLEGAVNLIDRERPVIVFEQGADSISKGTSPAIDFLREKGYRLYTIRNNFYLGPKRVARYASFALRLILGYYKEIVPTSHFESRFYEMIIGVPS